MTTHPPGNIRDIYGIGAKKATELRKYYNIRTIYDLRKYIRKIPDIITPPQRTGLKYYAKISRRIPYAEALKHATFLTKHLPHVTIAGSLRRGESKIGDIDAIITAPLAPAIATLTSLGYIISTLASGDEKFSGIARLPGTTNYRRLDLIRTTREEKPFALLYFTGDFVQNISMRQHAKKQGLTLSQHGLKHARTGRPIPNLKTERDIFAALSLDYKPPSHRIHEGREKQTLSALSA